MTQVLLMGCLFLAACWDWRFRRVPNKLVLFLGLAGFLYHTTLGEGWLALKGVALAFVLTFLPVSVRGMGMGDQKLLMAVAAWIGGDNVYLLFLISLIVSILPIFLYPKRWIKLYTNMYTLLVGWVTHRQVWLPSIHRSAYSLPYAVSLGISYCFLLAREGFR